MSFGSTFALVLHLASAGPQTHMIPMLSAELRTVFSGVSATSDLTFNRPEVFRADGTYALPARVPIGGHFWVENDRLCLTTQVEPDPRCRSFARTSDGRIFLISITSGGVPEEIVEPIPFILAPVGDSVDPKASAF